VQRAPAAVLDLVVELDQRLAALRGGRAHRAASRPHASHSNSSIGTSPEMVFGPAVRFAVGPIASRSPRSNSLAA
jgi:hypothetical protein